MVTIKHQATASTHMGALTQALVHPLATARTILAGEACGDGTHRHTGNPTIVSEPRKKQPPRRVAHTFCQRVILDHVRYLQVFVGNQVVRHDKRPCRLAGEVLTLPGNFQLRFAQSFDGLLAVLGMLLFARDVSLQALQTMLCFAQMAWVGNRIAFGVGIEGLQPHISADLRAGGGVVYLPVRFHGKLAIACIRVGVWIPRLRAASRIAISSMAVWEMPSA